MSGERESYSLTVPENMDGRRADEVLRAVFGVSDRQIRALKRQKGILLDRQSVYANAPVHAGQHLAARVQEEYDQGILPEPGALKIVFEDEDLLVLDKPSPLATLPMPGQETGTLANRVAYYLQRDRFVFRPVNRLDKGTSGLMTVAKTTLAHKRMMDLLHTADFTRGYTALCEGLIREDDLLLDAPIDRLEGDSVRRCVRPDGKKCLTRVKVLRRCEKVHRTLVSVQPETGRTHQIRVHLAYAGYPITGDYLYGTAHPELPECFALHSSSLSFVHPFTGERLAFSSELPVKIQKLCLFEE